MIYTTNKIYAKVWKVTKKEKYTDLNTTTSDKQDDGTYRNSNWIVRLVGKAHNVEVKEKDTIVITKSKIENIYDKERETSWLRVIAFEVEEQEKEDDFPF